jgi:hypothetical protein
MADMSFATYTDLKSAVASFLDRSDLTEQIPGFIRLAEAEIARRARRKRVRATVSVSSGAYTLPSSVGELASVTLASGTASLRQPVEIATKEMVDETRARYGGATGRPIQCARVGSELLFGPEPNATYSVELVYFEKLVPLSSSNTTTELLTEFPDVYLFGALLQSAMFLDHDERVPVWQSRFDAAITQVNTQRQREEFGGSLRPVRLPRVIG